MDFNLSRLASAGPVSALAVADDYLRAQAFHPALPNQYRFELLDARHSADIVRWRNDEENRHAFFQAGPLTLEDQANFLENYATRQRVDLVLARKDDGKPLGVFSLKNLKTAPELGKLMGEKSYRGKGLASSATLALLTFGFDWLHLSTIWAHTQKTNAANIQLNTKLGFQIESELECAGAAFWRMSLSRDRLMTTAL